MTKQPTALRLADECEYQGYPIDMDAAAELRRLHAVNQMLLEALEFCAGTSYITDAHEIAEKAIAKAKE
jgi:hypothetical protein